MHSLYHLIVYVPLDAADQVRKALAEAGAGRIGKYDSCSFSVRRKGRFRPLKDAVPAIGTPGSYEEVDEERIEVVVPADPKLLRPILEAVKAAHPYEEPAMHLLPMEDYHSHLDAER